MKQFIHIAGSAIPSAQATAIWPKAAELPANVLRFYVKFDGPAEASFDRATLTLLDDSGTEIPSPFLVFAHELWSPDATLLTVLIDPARIKRGLGAAAAHDAAIREGRSYSLTVKIQGGGVCMPSRATPPVFTALDERNWALKIPVVGSLEPLVVWFDRVMDRALCEEEIEVLRRDGTAQLGSVRLASDGRCATFSPEVPWQSGEHRLVFSASLEDVCGNRLGEPLDSAAGSTTGPRAGFILFNIS